MTVQLQEAIDAVRDTTEGEVSQLPGEREMADPEGLAVAVATAGGEVFSAGDATEPFALQSISKAFVYAMALAENGFAEVARSVDIEPSGESYDAISVEHGTGRPDNPMINAGAMTVHALVCGRDSDAEERDARILDVFSALAGRRLSIDEKMFEAEMEASHRNLAIAHMLRALEVLPDDPRDVVAGYLRQCAITVTTEDLALMGATLASGGRQPITGERIFEPDVCRQTLSVMMTCGMYDSAGDWVSLVGVPAKSGVAGGIVGAVPGRGGVATFSPRLDEHGNSVRGQLLFQRLSADLGVHFVDASHEEDERWEEAIRAEHTGSVRRANGDEARRTASGATTPPRPGRTAKRDSTSRSGGKKKSRTGPKEGRSSTGKNGKSGNNGTKGKNSSGAKKGKGGASAGAGKGATTSKRTTTTTKSGS